ncbi:MAG: acyl-CoA thioester hydrolase/BAAT C-terminal domain-containing protein [Ginsengibacter sp.]
MGKTTGDFDTSNSVDFAKDVEAGIQYLLSRKEVDRKHIGLIGHSEGGMIAPMVAVQNKNVSFIVCLQGPEFRGWRCLISKTPYPWKTPG